MTDRTRQALKEARRSVLGAHPRRELGTEAAEPNVVLSVGPRAPKRDGFVSNSDMLDIGSHSDDLACSECSLSAVPAHGRRRDSPAGSLPMIRGQGCG